MENSHANPVLADRSIMCGTHTLRKNGGKCAFSDLDCLFASVPSESWAVLFCLEKKRNIKHFLQEYYTSFLTRSPHLWF